MRYYSSTKQLLLALGLICLVGLCFPQAGPAQEAFVVEELHLSIWPEYYTPDVVVSQAFLFVNHSEESVSGEIWFQLPKNVEPTTLIDFKDSIYPRYFEVVDKGDHQLVRYELSSPLEPGDKLSLLLEYRYPRFQEAGHRNIPVEFISKYPVSQLTVEVTQPLRSTEFSLNPPTDDHSMDSDGFDVYRYSYTDIKAEELLEFSINYYKEDNLPSLDPEPAKVPGQETESSSISNTTVALIVLVLLGIFGAVLFIAFRNNPSPKEIGKGKKHIQGKAQKKGAPDRKESREVKEPVDQRKKLRKMLLEGRIDEKTYEKLIKELDDTNL